MVPDPKNVLLSEKKKSVVGSFSFLSWTEVEVEPRELRIANLSQLTEEMLKAISLFIY